MINRLLYIGQEATASCLFVDEGGTALTPKDKSLYPFYRVIDPEQELVIAGVGTLNQNTLVYECSFTIPNLSMVSTDNVPYYIEWEMVDITGARYNYREAFEVVYPDYDITAAKEQQKLTLPFTSLHLSLPLPNRISNVTLQVYPESSTAPIFIGAPSQLALYNDYYVYGAIIPPNVLTEKTKYLAVWLIEDNNSTYSYTQVIYCASLWEMSRLSDLRMYLDKVAKNVDIYQGYRDSDLYFYIIMGADLINSIGIPSSWSLNDWSTNYNLKDSYYWLMIAARHEALRAQYLAEGDSSFSFSAQPLTLDVDRSSFIESELGRLNDDLGKAAAWKNQVMRNMRAVGHLNLTSPSTSTRYAYMDLRSFGWNMRLSPTFKG